MKKLIILLAIFSAVAWQTGMAESEDGGYPGAFLKIPVQARPAAMGGAYIAIADDPAGQQFNPAGLHADRNYSFSSSYRAMKLDRQLSYLTFTLPTRLESALGFSWLYAGYGEVEKRDESGYLTGEILSSSEHAFGVTFSKLFTPFFAAGSQVSFYYKQHSDISANTVAISLGSMFYIDSLFRYGTMEDKFVTDITFGTVISNLAAEYPWDTEGSGLTATKDDTFPIRMGVGGSCRMFDRRFLLAADFEKNIEQSAMLRIGGEYMYDEKFSLRAGLNDGVLTAGTGFTFNYDQFKFKINYAFSDDRVGEGEDHIFTLDINF